MKINRQWLSPLFLSLILFCSGCAGAFQKPTITYKTLEIQEIGDKTATINFLFDVTNPNPVEVDNASADYEIFVNGRHITHVKNVKLNLAANDTTTVALPIKVNYQKAFAAGTSLAGAIIAGQKTVPYTLKTTFKFNVMLASVSLPKQIKGTLPLPEIKKINSKSIEKSIETFITDF